MLQLFEVSVGGQDLFEVPVRLTALWGNFQAYDRNFGFATCPAFFCAFLDFDGSHSPTILNTTLPRNNGKK